MNSYGTAPAPTKVTHRNRKGQVLVEFLLLFLTIATISFTMLGLVNGYLGTRWTALAKTIIGPTPTHQTTPPLRLR